MKAKILTIALIVAFATRAFSQRCSSDSLNLYPPGDVTYTQYGFADPNELNCIQTGIYSEVVIPFRCFQNQIRQLHLQDTTIVIQNLYAVKIESISNLPAGLCWITKPSNCSISGDELGALIVKGTTAIASGVYPLDLKLSINTKNNGYDYSGLATQAYEGLFGKAVLRVMTTNGECPSVNQ
jgi:hypothetical protein